jgi:hypothetical protein
MRVDSHEVFAIKVIKNQHACTKQASLEKLFWKKFFFSFFSFLKKLFTDFMFSFAFLTPVMSFMFFAWWSILLLPDIIVL